MSAFAAKTDVISGGVRLTVTVKTPDDVKAVAVPALAHRLTLRPELWVERRRSDDIVRELLERVPTPAVEQQPLPQ